VPLPKTDPIGEACLLCQGLCFAEQIGADVEIDDAVSTCGPAAISVNANPQQRRIPPPTEPVLPSRAEPI
jgi:hypothetical protein